MRIKRPLTFSLNVSDVLLTSVLHSLDRMFKKLLLPKFLLYFTRTVFALMIAAADSGVPGSELFFFLFHLPIYICYFRNPTFCCRRIFIPWGWNRSIGNFFLTKFNFKLKSLMFYAGLMVASQPLKTVKAFFFCFASYAPSLQNREICDKSR